MSFRVEFSSITGNAARRAASGRLGTERQPKSLATS
jgi:hypothetical protein